MDWIENSARNPLSLGMEKSLELCLFQSILRNDQDDVLRFLAQGANPNQTIKHGKTCLGEAASIGDTSIVRTLIDYTKIRAENSHTIHGTVRKTHAKANKRKIKEENDTKSNVKCKTVCDETYYIEYGKAKTEQNNLQRNQGYFILIHSDGSSSDECRTPSLKSVSPPCLTPSPQAELEWDEDLGNVAPPTNEDETWSSMYQWYASILESTGAAIAAASAITCGIDQQDAFMRTALHYAVEHGHPEVVKLLIQAGCNLDIVACNGHTPLHIAVLWERPDIVKLLLDAGCQVNYTTPEMVTALHFAAARGFLDMVKYLVVSGANLEAKDTNECTALFLAVSGGHHEVVDYLISSGADFNGEEIHGYPAICVAVWERKPRVVEVLLKAGARIANSYKLLHNAVIQHEEEIVRLLADAGVGVNLYNDSGDTPLLLAVRLGVPRCAHILLDRGAKVNACNRITGATALHIAVESSECPDAFQSMLRLLLRYGVDMNATSLIGDTPLNRALLLQQDPTAAILIRHGAEVNACDLQLCGLDNLSIASRRTTNHLANLLIKAGHIMPIPEPHPIPKKLQGSAAMWLHETCRHPLSLIDLCRIKVRRQNNGQNMTLFIESLPLPDSLKSFLMMDDEYSFYGYRGRKWQPNDPESPELSP